LFDSALGSKRVFQWSLFLSHVGQSWYHLRYFFRGGQKVGGGKVFRGHGASTAFYSRKCQNCLNTSFEYLSSVQWTQKKKNQILRQQIRA
jgi:hypothetical protein